MSALFMATALLLCAPGARALTMDDETLSRARALLGIDRLLVRWKKDHRALARNIISDLIEGIGAGLLEDAPLSQWQDDLAKCFDAEFKTVIRERSKAVIGDWLGNEENVRALVAFADTPMGRELFDYDDPSRAQDLSAFLARLDEDGKRRLATFMDSPAGQALRSPPTGIAASLLDGMDTRLMEACVLDGMDARQLEHLPQGTK